MSEFFEAAKETQRLIDEMEQPKISEGNGVALFVIEENGHFTPMITITKKMKLSSAGMITLAACFRQASDDIFKRMGAKDMAVVSINADELKKKLTKRQKTGLST